MDKNSTKIILKQKTILVFLNTLGNKEYFTLAKGGYIINIKPMAMGILVVPLLNELTKSGKVGKK